MRHASMPRFSAARGRLSLPAALCASLLACAGDQHDGDGGVLMVREEQRVKEWLTELDPLIKEVGEIDWLSLSFGSFTGSSTGPTIDDVRDLMRRLSRTRPPPVADLDADRTLREFHGALHERADSIIEFFDHMDTYKIGPLSFPWMAEDMEAMDAAENSLQYHGMRLAGKITSDYQDDPDFQRELQVLFNTVSTLFSKRGRLRTLPSMMSSVQGAPIPPGSAPPPSAPPSGYGSPTTQRTGGLGPIRKLPSP